MSAGKLRRRLLEGLAIVSAITLAGGLVWWNHQRHKSKAAKTAMLSSSKSLNLSSVAAAAQATGSAASDSFGNPVMISGSKSIGRPIFSTRRETELPEALLGSSKSATIVRGDALLEVQGFTELGGPSAPVPEQREQPVLVLPPVEQEEAP